MTLKLAQKNPATTESAYRNLQPKRRVKMAGAARQMFFE
jgi:hypothetical protein